MYQLPPPNKITDEDWLQRVGELLSTQGEFSRVSQATIKNMFELYNDKLLPRETGTGCGGCRGRVFNRLKQEYEKRKA